MHLNNLTDQTLAAYTNHVIHIRISHTFGNYQRSCYLLNGSSAHLNQSPAFSGDLLKLFQKSFPLLIHIKRSTCITEYFLMNIIHC